MSNIFPLKGKSHSARPTLDKPALDKAIGAFENLRLLVQDEMKGVDKFIHEKMASDEATIPDISAHIAKAGGKRLRPMLTLAAAHLCNYQGRDHIALAAAIELMHTATLLHDDVVDESNMRRGRAASRMVWGNAASVLVGDFMLGQAFKIMVGTGSLAVLDLLSNAAAIIAEGEVMQLAANHIDMTENACLRIMDAKTATLFSAATHASAIIAEQDMTTCAALSSYGRNLGMAFQLTDDALDYAGTSILGKNLGDDFREGKVTLPIVLAYQRGDKTERAFWQRVIGSHNQKQGDFEQAVDFMKQHNVLATTMARAEHYSKQAEETLAIFPQNEISETLINIATFCVNRNY